MVIGILDYCTALILKVTNASELLVVLDLKGTVQESNVNQLSMP